MSLFSGILDFIKIPEPDSVGDDNAGLSAEQNNSFLSAPVLGMRTAYDSMHLGFAHAIKGKQIALRQLDKYIKNWIDTLNKLVHRYEEMLSKIDEINSDVGGVVTLDFAKEAWEIVQDTPILRRYLGEANYWYLYDTLGLMSTQTVGISASMMSTVKETLKKSILTIIAATDGLLNTQSYVSYIQSSWGFLFVKCLDVHVMDSVLPQVTTAYWYKPIGNPTRVGEQHQVDLYNNPPGIGFSAVPLPVPKPDMVLTNKDYLNAFNPQNPDTWYLDGEPYYMPGTMDMLRKALEYWGSSYTDAVNVPNAIYKRRPYIQADGTTGTSPLVVGKFLGQLDNTKMSITGSLGGSEDYRTILGQAFTPTILKHMVLWQECYEGAYECIVQWIFDTLDSKSSEPGYVQPTTVYEFMQDYEDEYHSWCDSDAEDAVLFKEYIHSMHTHWQNMLEAYALDNRISMDTVSYPDMFDAIMKALVGAAHNSVGYEFSMPSENLYVVAPSCEPTASKDASTSTNAFWLGVPYVAYTTQPNRGKIVRIGEDAELTTSSSVVNVEYPTNGVSFVMFPSHNVDYETLQDSCITLKGIAGSVLSGIIDVKEGLTIGDSIDTGTIVEYVFDINGDAETHTVGKLPMALYMHKAAGYYSGDEPSNVGTYFFPDGKLPESRQSAKPFPTYYTVYKSYVNESDGNAVDELADIVGYAINRGREPKYPCFGVYGNLLCMASWCYKEMLHSDFMNKYAPIKSGSKLYYNVANPNDVILYHSSYQSSSRGVKLAIYHEHVATETKSYGSSTYEYYVYPGESIAVYKVPTSGNSMATQLSINAKSPSGDGYHYVINKNPIPLVPKYVDPDEWSFVDIMYEMLLLAHNLASLCGDNGKRLQQLEDSLKDFGATIPRFIGELPSDSGKIADFRLEVMDKYASMIDTAVNEVYTVRERLIAATNNM